VGGTEIKNFYYMQEDKNISKKEKILRKVAWRLRSLIGISPNGLSFVRVFGTPWIAILLIETLSRESVLLAILTIVLYSLIVLTDLFDGPLARAIQTKSGVAAHDSGYGGVLDRVSDKLLIVFSLVPFGAHPLIVVIITGESFLLYQALHAQSKKKKQATYVGKIKMLLQTFLLPLLLAEMFIMNPIYIPAVNAYMALTVIFTALSVVSHYRK
jgi:phosphatidylglycerophosphate synthase